MLKKDGDGFISKGCFAGFDCIGTDEDGYISTKEFYWVAHPSFVFDTDFEKISHAEYNAGFNVIDPNKNGKFSVQEGLHPQTRIHDSSSPWLRV